MAVAAGSDADDLGAVARGARVVVLDDEESNRRLLCRLLHRLGVSDLLAVSSAAELPGAVRQVDPDLLIVDQQLGDGLGMQALADLAVQDPRWWSRRVLMVTGALSPATEAAVEALGAAAALRKPFQFDELAAAVGELLARPSRLAVPSGRERPDSRTERGPVDFQALFEGAPGSFLVLDAQLVIVAVTDAYLAATMTERGSIEGRLLFEAFPGNPDDPTADGVSNLQASLDRVRNELVADTMPIQHYDVRRPDGTFEVRHWSPINIPITDAAGALRYIIHRVEDVTDYVRMRSGHATVAGRWTMSLEAQIFLHSRELERVNRALQATHAASHELLSRVSHELRAPLTAVVGYGDLLARSDLDATQREWAGIQRRAAEHTLGLLEDILAIASVNSGGLSLRADRVDVGCLVEEAVDIIKPLARERGITIANAAIEGPSREVIADRQRLRQVLINLLSNAIKYNRPEGYVAVTVLPAAAGRVALSIADTGPGISEDDQTRLFTPFERLDAATSGVAGSGLGLAVCRELITAMDGTITLASTPGEGCTFTIELPTSAGEPADREEADVQGVKPRAPA